MKRALSLLLTLALALTLLPGPARAYSQAFGGEVWLQDTELHDGTVLSENIFWSDYYNKPRHEYYITYSPRGSVIPVASYGESVTSRATVSEAAEAYEAMGYRVVGAINGDFYDTVTGYPLGLLVSGGEILSGSNEHYAVGFYPDGSAVLGQPGLTITASKDGATQSISSLNKPRVDGAGLTMFTADYRADYSTNTTTPGVSVLCTIWAGEATLGGALTLLVEEVIEGTEPIILEEDQVVLTGAADGYTAGLSFLRSLAPMDEITVSFTPTDPRWEGVTEAVGAYHLLVENGVPRSDFKVDTAPRTAVGLRPNGEVVFYTLDGRQEGHSMGSSLNVLAQRMAELGCVTALCLDGGGSTTLTASTPDRDTSALINSPSDKVQRKVSNHLLLLAEGYPTGEAESLYLSAGAPAVLTGHQVDLRANLVDTAHFPMEGDVELYASAGEIVDGVFYAPQEPGMVNIIAWADGMEADIDLLVVDTPDTVEILWDGVPATDLTLIPGDTAELTVTASYNHLPLDIDPDDFTWTVPEELGYVDAFGILHTNFAEGTGTITATKGEKTITIPLTLDGSSPFVDTQGHWASAYLAALYHKEVLTGVTVDDQLYAYPDKGVTRAEFSVLLARYLGLNTADYATVETPFADMDKVDFWAADAVRAMFAMGIVGGIETPDGELIFDPQGTLTRSQAVTMLGRLRTGEEEPVEPADLSIFPDADQIYPYALEHFQTMVALGVIGGSDGKLDPNGTMTRAAICKVLATLPY